MGVWMRDPWKMSVCDELGFQTVWLPGPRWEKHSYKRWLLSGCYFKELAKNSVLLCTEIETQADPPLRPSTSSEGYSTPSFGRTCQQEVNLASHSLAAKWTASPYVIYKCQEPLFWSTSHMTSVMWSTAKSAAQSFKNSGQKALKIWTMNQT